MSSLNGLIRLSKDRLEANRRLLLLLDPGSPEHATHVARQKTVFDTALRAMPSMPEDLAVDLCEDVARVGWPSHTEQIAAIMDHVVPPAELRLFGQPVAPRTQQQNYVELEHHLPARIWTAASEVFMRVLVEFLCVDLGLQYASEMTQQKIVAVALLVKHGRSGAAETSFQYKRSLMDVAKRCLKQHRYLSPVEWIANLPADQVSLRAQFPGQWNQSQARGENTAVPCPHHATDVAAVVSMVPMRNSMKRTAENNISSGAPLGNSLGANAGGPVHDVVRMLAQLLGGSRSRGPGDGEGGIALEYLQPRQQLQVVMNSLMG